MLRHFGWIVGLIVLCSSGAPAGAQPLAEGVPDDVVVYLAWQGSANPGAGFAGSHLQEIVNNSRLGDLITEFWPKLLERVARDKPADAENLELVGVFASMMWKHPTALFFAPGDPNDPLPVRVGLLCAAGADAPRLKQDLDDLLDTMLQDAPVPVASFLHEGRVGIGIGYNLNQIATPRAMLKGAAAFTEATANAGPDPWVVLYADVERLLAWLDRMAELKGGPNPQDWARFRQATGLGGLRRVVYSAGFADRQWASRVFVDAPAPRTGILKMLEGSPAPERLLDAAPGDANFVAVASFDIAAILTEVRKVAGAFDPQAQRTFDQAMGGATMFIGRNFLRDVLEPLGEHWLFYSSPQVGGTGILGTVMVNQLDDPAKAKASLDQTWRALDNAAAGLQQRNEMAVRARRTTIGGMEINYVGTPLVAPAWVVHNDRLYVGLYPQMVATAAGRPLGGDSIRQNPRFASLVQKLGGDRASSLTYVDPAASAQTMYQAMLMYTRLGTGLADMAGIDAPEPLLPPYPVLLANLAPAASVTWTDEKGLHMRSIQPFPMSGLFSEQTLLPAAAPLSLGILMPSMNRARVTADRVKSASNLRQIGQALLMYSNENRNRYPDTLGELVRTQDITVDVFVSPLTGTAMPPRGLTLEQLADWVNRNSDYVYVGKGKNNTAGADTVVAYENPDRVREGINILFGDGHVEWMKMPEARDLLAKQGLR